MINILIVSENEISRKSLQAYLQMKNIAECIEETKDINGIITKYKDTEFDIVIIDLYSNAFSWINSINNLVVKKYNPNILAFIPNSFVYGIKVLMDIGATGYLSKNCTEDSLLEAINKVAKDKKYFSKELASNYFNAQISNSKDYLDLKLSKREMQIIALIRKGFDSVEIGDQLEISKRTVEWHKDRIYKKTNVNNNAALIHFANYELGMLTA